MFLEPAPGLAPVPHPARAGAGHAAGEVSAAGSVAQPACAVTVLAMQLPHAVLALPEPIPTHREPLEPGRAHRRNHMPLSASPAALG